MVLLAPFISFINALIAIALSYGVNSSDSVDTLMSWSCRWRHVSMTQAPYFNTLCGQSQAGLGLMIVLVPLSLVAFGLAAYPKVLDKKQGNKTAFMPSEKPSTPESMQG